MKHLTGRKLIIVFSRPDILCSGGCIANYKLTVENSLARPGEKTRLSARLILMDAPVLNQTPEKQDLAFYVDDLLVGMKETSGGGYASVGYRPKDTGVKQVKVLFTGRTYQAAGVGRIFVWKKEATILIVDLNTLIGQKNRGTIPLTGEDYSKPAPGAVDALEKLSKQFHLVYLTRQARETIPATRSWLVKNDFPIGPVLKWDLDEIQTAFSRVWVGIGNADQDYQAYRERKIFTILLDPTQPAEKLEDGFRVPDWNSVTSVFKAGPQTKPAKTPTRQP